jgi:hypothetical protein
MSLIHEIDFGTPRSKAEKMVTLTVDGVQVTVPEGTSIMRAAVELGREIPKLCATPAGFAWSRSRAATARQPPAPRRWPKAWW